MLNLLCFIAMIVGLLNWDADASTATTDEQPLLPDQLRIVQQLEQQRIRAIETVIGSVIAIYGEQREGGGSGVIIDPSGIGLTNHHVIIGAGTSGWGGLADGEMYRWKLIGTDPGGDVAVIQLEGKQEFPFTPLGDSDRVQVGDWALAMGNPFVLAEDQSPTVTLGIISGIKRYQPGAGLNQLVYGNCIQTDSSINPGNSGGPLFNLKGQVIGINGRGSFEERGRVNVGLGYAISANQIRNFIPDLLATKLVEHGTLDASFEDRNGKVVCANLYEDAKLYRLGVRPGDELLEFEGEKIETANQFTNLICTLPEDWPATLTVRQSGGNQLRIHTRLYGLPYEKPQRPPMPEDGQEQTPEQREQLKRALEMIELLSAPPGTIRSKEVNQHYAQHLLKQWQDQLPIEHISGNMVWNISDSILENGRDVGSQEIWITRDGRFKVSTILNDRQSWLFWDGSELSLREGEQIRKRSEVETKLNSTAVQALGILAANGIGGFASLGDTMLDGSDKSQHRNAYRFKVLDDDRDAFYFWLRMPDAADNAPLQLSKAGADMNCELGSGGVLFSDWSDHDGLRVANRRTTIVGLAETEKLTFQTVSVTSEPLEDGQLENELRFSADGSNDY